MNTYQLLTAADNLLTTSGEMTPEEFEAALSGFIEASTDKLAALRAVNLKLSAQADTYKAEAARLTEARRASEARAERVKSSAYALLCKMREAGEAPVVPGVARIQTNGGKVPLLAPAHIDVSELPEDLVIIERKPNIDAIRGRLEAGREVPGFQLGERGEGVRFA